MLWKSVMNFQMMNHLFAVLRELTGLKVYLKLIENMLGCENNTFKGCSVRLVDLNVA
jgi:hypothetical protein